ncbi:MAG: tungstate ABC transporter substrate-binding protein WtpA [Syntrophomonadaceae bacterium]
MPKWLNSLLVLCLITGCAGCTSLGGKKEPPKTELRVIIAGSLLLPFQNLEQEFENLNPDIDVLLDGHGSVQVIRAVTELGSKADLVAVADAQLIPLMMYPLPEPQTGKPYADWSIKFSTNRLGIAYKEESAYASEIDAGNWHKIIARPDVTIGLPDPRIDAMGYRTLMAIQLAEGYYGDDRIFERTIGTAFNPPLVIERAGGVSVITVPDVVKSTEPRVKLRSYSIQLMALLESGDLDYAFEYESVAKQRGLKFLELPAEIDLSSPEHEQQYREVQVNLDFKRFASVKPQFRGTQIVYGLTIPANVMHPAEAERFIEFLLGQDGRRIMAAAEQPLLLTPVCDNRDALPDELKTTFP